MRGRAGDTSAVSVEALVLLACLAVTTPGRAAIADGQLDEWVGPGPLAEELASEAPAGSV